MSRRSISETHTQIFFFAISTRTQKIWRKFERWSPQRYTPRIDHLLRLSKNLFADRQGDYKSGIEEGWVMHIAHPLWGYLTLRIPILAICSKNEPSLRKHRSLRQSWKNWP